MSEKELCLNNNCNEAVGLLITYQCNLNCKYCYIKEKRNLNMTFEKAKDILEPFLLKDGGIVDIVFMGAETLLAESVIKQVVEWAEQGTWKRRFRFFGSTNGTLLNSQLKQWFYDHRQNIVLGLSFDGLPSIQEKNRGCSVADIDIDFFINTWPLQPIQMTIDSESVYEMANGVIYLLEKGAFVHPNVAYEEKQWSRKAIIEYGRQLNALIGYYLKNDKAPSITQFEHNLIEYAGNLGKSIIQPRVCGAGDGFQVFDVDGTSYPCHILSPLVLNKEKLKRIQEGILAQTDSFSDPRCSHCPYCNVCSTCLASNYLYRNDFVNRDKTHCYIMHQDVRAFMKKEIIRLSMKKELSSEEALEVDAINVLLDYEQHNSIFL